MTDKETLVQLALGTLPMENFLNIVHEATSKEVLLRAGKLFASMGNAKEGKDADAITNAFFGNPHTPTKLKSYIMAARQLQVIMANRRLGAFPRFHACAAQKSVDKTYKELLEDD